MAKKNVLLVIDALSGGGAELVVANLCRGLSREHFAVSICCLAELGGRGTDLVSEGYEVDVLPKARGRVGKYLRWHRLARLARDRQIHLMHSHSPSSLIDCALAGSVLRSTRHVHTFHFGNYARVEPSSLRMEKLMARRPDRLVAVGYEQRNALTRALNLDSGRVEVVWNGITIEGPELDIAPGEHRAMDSKGPVVIGSISTLIEQKGLPDLLDTAGILNMRGCEFELWIAGDGPLKGDLMSQAEDLGIHDKVKFLGWVNNSSITVLPKIDIFVQSSLWEAMSMSVLEAMGAAKPVVVTDVGDNRHVIRHGEDGYVIPIRDPNAMADALELLIRDESLRRRVGSMARHKVLSDCTVSRMAGNYERIYLDALGDAANGRDAAA